MSHPVGAGPIVRAIDRLFSGQEDPFALGVVRAVIAGLLCLSALLHVGSVGEYFSDESMINGRFARLAFPGRWSLFFTIRDPTAVRAIWGLGVAALALWSLGLFTRISSVIGMLVWISMYGRNHLLYAYPDQLALFLGFLLALMPAGRGFSLDARWRGRGGTVPIWCRRLIQLEIAIVYTVTGLEKTGDAWRVDGTAIWYTLTNPYNRHFDAGPFLASLQPWLLRPMTFVVRWWEVLFGPFLALHWIRDMVGRRLPAWGKRAREGKAGSHASPPAPPNASRPSAPPCPPGEAGWPIPDARWLFLPFGIAMHVGIQLGVYVVFFSVLMLGSYLAFFDSDELRRAGARLRRLRKRLLPSRR